MLSLVGKRDMLISLHKVRATDWDFDHIGYAESIQNGFIKKIRLKRCWQWRAIRLLTGNTVALIFSKCVIRIRVIFFIVLFVDNHFVASYTSGLVESAIDSRSKPKIGLDHAFY